jgi:hypothetical protein
MAIAVAILALLAQSSPPHHAAAQAAATATPTVTGTATVAGTATATATATTVTAPVETPATAVIPTGFCGTVSSFTPATSGAAGSVTFSGTNLNQTFSIAPGTVLANSAAVSTGANLCLIYTLGTSNAITSGQFVANNPVQIVVCGMVTGYTPATSSATGVLDIGGIGLATGLGSTFTGGTPTVGQTQSLTLTLNGLGLVTTGTVAAGNCPNGPTLAGTFSAYTAATSTTAGSITFGFATFPIAAGTNLTVSAGGVPLAASPVGGSTQKGATYFL